MAKDHLYSARLDLIGYSENTNQVIFGGKAESARWGESDNGREVEGTEFKFDRKYWELMGKPEFLLVGMGSEEGFEKYVGPPPKAKVAVWMEAAS